VQKHERTTLPAYTAVRRETMTSIALKTVADGLHRLSLAEKTTALILRAI